MTTSTLVCNY